MVKDFFKCVGTLFQSLALYEKLVETSVSLAKCGHRPICMGLDLAPRIGPHSYGRSKSVTY